MRMQASRLIFSAFLSVLCVSKRVEEKTGGRPVNIRILA